MFLFCFLDEWTWTGPTSASASASVWGFCLPHARASKSVLQGSGQPPQLPVAWRAWRFNSALTGLVLSSYARLAQSVEHQTLNLRAAGSSRTSLRVYHFLKWLNPPHWADLFFCFLIARAPACSPRAVSVLIAHMPCGLRFFVFILFVRGSAATPHSHHPLQKKDIGY